jgi:hypothetical protein
MLRSAPLLVAAALLAVAASGCPSDSVDCEALCARLLACNVTLAPTDDPDLEKVASGERTDPESCALGCADSPVVTVENAACVDDVDITGDQVCQDNLMGCLGLSAPQ